MEKKKFLVIDVETCGSLDKPLVYDVGGAIIDNTGKIYEHFSFIIEEVFYGCQELMQSAYYADKIPQYKQDLFNGKRRVATFPQFYNFIRYLINKYQISVFLAYNARFDKNALNNTIQFLTDNKYKYFLPNEIDIQCIWTMAKDTICKQKSYEKFCLNNGFITNKGNLKTTAEIVYRYITIDNNFIESHTGFEDVKIETLIFVKCLRQHKKMRKHYWDKL